MKIGLVGPTYPFRGGIAHHTTLLCNALRREHEVEFVSFRRQYPAFLFPGGSDRDPSAEPLKADGARYLIDSLRPSTWRAAADFLADFAPRKVVFPWWVSFWTPQFLYLSRALRSRTGAEICFVCHNVFEHGRNPLSRLCSRAVLGRADRVVTHSKPEAERARRLLPACVNVVAAFHPVYDHLRERMPDPDSARRALGVTSPVLLFFGFVRPYKGLNVLLRALPEVVARHDATLMVVGEFWKGHQECADRLYRAGLSDHVRIVDRYVPDEEAALYFAAADLVVLPYLSGTGSGVCQMARGMQKPVVGTRVGSIPEAVRDGVDGRLVEPGDPEALADALCNALRPKNLERLKRGAASSVQAFSWEKFADIVAG